MLEVRINKAEVLGQRHILIKTSASRSMWSCMRN